MTEGQRWLWGALAGGVAIAAASVALGFTVDRPLVRLLDAIGPFGLVGLGAAALISYAARWLRGVSVTRAPALLLIGWMGLRLAMLVAAIVLLAAWLVAYAAGLELGSVLFQALTVEMVAGGLAFIASSAIRDLVLAIRGP